jgi:hypothetical protein
MIQPVVFISYSNKDKREKDRLLVHLRFLERQGLISLWSDDRTGPGADWVQEISEAIVQARVGILLISPDFLALVISWDFFGSDFYRRFYYEPIQRTSRQILQDS